MAGLGGKIGTLLLCGGLGATLIPACVIRIGPGSGESDETTHNPTGSDGLPADSSGEELTPEEQEVADMLQNADPEQLKIGAAMAVYAAVGSASLVEAQIANPNTVDDATVEQLFNEYAPVAIDEAIAWASSLDPATLPTAWNTVNFACEEEPYTCPRKEYCSFGTEPVLCVISSCGTSVGSSRVDLQACKLEYSIVSPK